MKISRILIGLALVALPAMCSTILPDGSWYSFAWNGSPTTPAFGGLSTFTADLGTTLVGTPIGTVSWEFTGPANIFVQDLFYDGDRFEVIVDSISQGVTSAPSNDATSCGNDPAGCVGLPKFSSGLFAVGGGAHSLTINVIAETTGLTTGGAAFQLSAVAAPEVPEPTTLGLIGLGLVGLAFRWRTKRS